MRLLPMVRQFRQLFWVERNLSRLEHVFFWMLLLFLWVLRLLEELWLCSSLETQLFLLKNLKSSLHMLTINLESVFRCLREKDKWLETTILLVNLTWMVFLLLQEVFLKFRYLSRLMPMELWTWQLLIREQQRMPKLLLLTTKGDFLKSKLNDLWKRLRNSKIRMKKLVNKSRVVIVLKDIVST